LDDSAATNGTNCTYRYLYWNIEAAEYRFDEDEARQTFSVGNRLVEVEVTGYETRKDILTGTTATSGV
jgi:hypothetical protein